MKKTVCIILAIILTASSLSGCAFGKKLTAYELYAKAVDAIRDAGGFECSSETTMSMLDSDNEPMEDSTSTFKMTTRQKADLSTVAVEMDGETVTTTITGDDVYVDSSDTKYRYKLPEDQHPADVPPEQNALPTLTEEFLKDVEVTENEDGTKQFTAVLDDILDEVLETNKSYLASIGGEDATYENFTVTMIFDADNNLVTLEQSALITQTVLGYFTITQQAETKYTFKNIGTAPDIAKPDPDNYELLDEGVE